MNQMQCIDKPTKHEIAKRIEGLYEAINKQEQHWDAAFIIDKVNQYYFTGSMQDGLFVLKKDGSTAYFVRRSFERAKEECLIDDVYPMTTYKDVKEVIGQDVHTILVETEIITYAALERLKKHFRIDVIHPVDAAVLSVRSIKSPFELSCMQESGRQHQYILETIVPSLLKEGMSETEFAASLYEKMIGIGYQGVTRFAMFQTELVMGQFGFGENSLYPTSFDGPGGMKGMHPAAPLVGDRNRLLKKGDLVFADIGYGVNGYHTDRTQIYMFAKHPDNDLINIHRKCIDIQKKAALLLKPGNIPNDIYNTIMGELDAHFLQNFMGFGQRRTKFLGHGVGLHVDESPVIANGFHAPLEKNMVVALEPKKGVAGYGLVGVEDTYIVTQNGGQCITGGEKDIIVI